VQPADAYRACAEIARESGTSFYRGMRLLPQPRRDALFAVYAFARRVDDIADGDLDDDAKLAALAELRRSFAARDGSDDPVFVALADVCATYPMQLAAFEDLILGAEMDANGASFEKFDELVVYCRRVGGSIGRLSVGIFGATDVPRALSLADDLGVAFQLTNILRDIREDFAGGRVYLPQEDLRAFETGVEPGPRFERLVRYEAERAGRWYATGLELLTLLDRPSAQSTRTMATAYSRLLRRIARDPEAVLTRRVSLPPWEKGWVAARSLVGAGT
jgi:phytoene synthase